MRKLALAIFFSLSVAYIYAQTKNAHKTLTLDSVEVKARAVKDNITSSVPTDCIRKGQIEQMGITSVADAVKKFAGVTVRDYGGIGGLKTVSIRNLGANHTAVSYDGIIVSNMSSGQIDIGRFSIENIDNLSITIGQENDYMQSASQCSSAGILSIKTERPYFLNGKSYSIMSRIRVGSFGLISPSVRFWQKFNSSTTFSYDCNFTRADGTYPFTLVNGKLKTKEKRYNSDVNSYHAEINLFHNFSDSSKISWKTYYYNSHRGLPGAVILYNNYNDERLWDKNFFTQAIYSKGISRQWQLVLRTKYANSWNKYEDINVKYQDGKQTDINRQNEYYTSATIGYEPFSNAIFSISQDVVVGTLNNNIGLHPNPTRYTSLTSFFIKYVTETFNINANIVGTYIHEHTENGSSPNDRKRLSPMFSLSYRIFKGKSLFIRAMAKSTFRVPTFTDLYYLRIGNIGLKPEKATEYNLGLTYGVQISQIDVQITTDGYYNNVKDKIVAFPTTYIWKMTNFGKVDVKGFDASLAINIPITKCISADASATYALQHAVDKTDAGSSIYGKQLPYTPKNNFNGSIVIKTPWINIGYTVTACDKRYSMAQDTEEYKLNHYQEHNISMSHEFIIRNNKLQLSATLLNITNAQYDIIKYYPMPGRNLQIMATLTR
jgi:vitamin B12 transporter